MVICLPAHFLLSGSLSLCVAQDAGFRDGHMQDNCSAFQKFWNTLGVGTVLV